MKTLKGKLIKTDINSSTNIGMGSPASSKLCTALIMVIAVVQVASPSADVAEVALGNGAVRSGYLMIVFL